MKNSTKLVITGVIVVGGLLAILSKVRQDAVLAADPPATSDVDRADPWKQYLGADRLDPAPGDDELQTLLKARFNAAVAAAKAQLQNVRAGRATWDGVLAGYAFVRDAWIALHDKPADQVRAWEFYLAMARQSERECEELVKGGRLGNSEFAIASYFRSDAEVQLLLAKRRAAGK